MYRIDNATAISPLPAPTVPGPNPNSFFTGGNPAGGIPATIVDAEWLNGLQEEICNVITAAGITLDKSVRTQLLSSIKVLGRIRLIAPATFYVSTTGNDSTGNGTIGTPWRTAQHASDYVQSNLDLNGYQVTIVRADGAYTDSVTVTGPYWGGIGQLPVIFSGSASVNVGITTAGACYTSNNGATFGVQNQKLVSTGNSCLVISGGAFIGWSGIDFGAANNIHVFAANTGNAAPYGNYQISGNATNHIVASNNSAAGCSGVTVTTVGTPAFSSSFAAASANGTLQSIGTNFAGSGATGARYSAALNGVINTQGGGANYFPGDSVGATSTGGQYA